MPVGQYTRADPITRFWRRINKNGPTHPIYGQCWQWRGKPHRSGYGRHRAATRVVYAHRFSYELLVGPIPEGLQLDHLCRNALCVRPEHLEAVTQRVNMNRGIGAGAQNARKTHCPQGHPLNGDNLYTWLIKRTDTWGRRCRRCSNERRRVHHGRKPTI